jgi:hypothetical protein
VSAGWAVSLPLDRALDAAPLRLHPEIEACTADGSLWLRGVNWDEAFDLLLRKMLGAERFHRLTENRIAPWGCALPTGVLPDGQWMPFKDWLQPAVPPTILAGRLGPRGSFRLVREAQERSANLLCTTFDEWQKYALSAPLVRLSCLSFAVSNDAQVLIRGEPLPPLPGTRFVECSGIAVPAGWTWLPAIDAEVLRESLGLDGEDIALMAPAGECETIRRDDFVSAARSAVRLTAREIGRA